MRLVFRLTLALTILVAAGSASAAPGVLPPVKRTLAAAGTTARTCHAGLATGRGLARTAYRAPMSGFVTIRGAGAGNWDLAVYDARTGHAVSSSESFGSSEVAQNFVGAGQRLIIQGCHKSGRASTFRIATTFVDAKPPAAATPSLVRVNTTNGGILDRLTSLGFDVTENVRDGHADVVAPSADKLALLKTLGLDYSVRSADLRRDYASARMADVRYAQRLGAAGSPLPSGRTTYRSYADYQTELADIVKAHKDDGLVRPITLGKSYQGREIQGIEVAQNVNSAADGRPVYLLVALHHAREWPSAEIAMEFAHMVVDGYGKDGQITSLLRRERIVIVPIINPDGFIASRGTNPDPADTLLNNGLGTTENYQKVLDALGQGAPLGFYPFDWDTAEGVFLPFGGNLAYRRKNCDTGVVAGLPHDNAEQNLPCYYRVGVDPNRNYGYGWGGLGGSTDPNTQSYRGTSQWSEPETQNVWHWSQGHNVSMIITLHNVAALVLRPPGQHTDGLAPDEARMKEVGDAMAGATGYTSQYGWQLYDTTGTTEDWTYGGQGSFGYTIEIGPAGGRFHMPYKTGVVDEWTGAGAHSGHGMREALLIAAESAGNPQDHSIVEGAAKPGSVLRLKKTFDTLSSPVCTFAQGNLRSGGLVSPLDCVAPGPRQSMPDRVEYTTVVPPSGRYEWHVPPSTRPFVARHVTPGTMETTPYRQPETWTAQPGDVKPDAAIDGGTSETKYSAERTFTVDEPGTKLVLDLQWTLPPQDFDLKLYHVAAGGKLEPAGTGSGTLGGSSGSSGNPNGVPEQITVTDAPTGSYVARVTYYLTGADKVPQANDWKLTLSRYRKSPDKVETGREEYTLTCETGAGQVLDTRQVYVERGQRAAVDICSPAGAPSVRNDGGGSTGDQVVLGNKQAGGTKRAAGKRAKRLSRRAACLREAGRIKARGKRRAAVRSCNKRFGAKAKTHRR